MVEEGRKKMIETAAANLTIREKFTVISSLYILTVLQDFSITIIIGKGVIFSCKNDKKDSKFYIYKDERFYLKSYSAHMLR